jgi:hypothetical protein
MSIGTQGNVSKDSTTAPRGGWRLPLARLLPALLVGLALRIFLVLRFPVDSPDTQLYVELARNWLTLHVYGLTSASAVIPTDIRVPGYPAFLALLCLLVGCGRTSILLAQAVLDLGTCLLVAWLAARLVSGRQRPRVTLAALWLAATCPFVANYAAVPLTEVLATFLTAAALVAFVGGLDGIIAFEGDASKTFPWMPQLSGAFLVGLGTMVRPETPLLLVALALVLMVRWRRPADWSKLVRVGTITAIGLLLPLAPWAARNWVRFHEVQPLAPRFATSPDEFVPTGLYAWTATWLVRYRDVYVVPWHVDGEPINLAEIPPYAFDSPDERARGAALLDQYNEALAMSPEIDRGFAQLARERSARHPLRTWLWVPAQRVATLWLTPRVDLLPVSGHLMPLGEKWQEDRVDFGVTVLLGALNFFYVGLAVAALRRCLGPDAALRPGARIAVALLVAFVVVRTLFLTQSETPEPRYVLECFPAVFVLASFCWLGKSPTADQAARDES